METQLRSWLVLIFVSGVILRCFLVPKFSGTNSELASGTESETEYETSRWKRSDRGFDLDKIKDGKLPKNLLRWL